MSQTPSADGADSIFTFDPTNKVVGSIDEVADAKAALSDLTAAGFTVAEIELVTSEEGRRRIGVSDDRGGMMIHIFHPGQKVPAFYDTPVITSRIEEELRADHYLIGVATKDDVARQRVTDILKSHSAHFINFYGRWAAHALEP